MNRKDLDAYEKLSGQLQSIYEEISLLSKKNPNDAVNQFKLSFINDLLTGANTFLGTKYAPFKGFAKFDEETLPQNSDVTFMLSQYLQCFEKYRADNVIQLHGTWQWALKAEGSEKGDERGLVYVRTVTPRHLRS